jgi:pyocin large subunit-like protein
VQQDGLWVHNGCFNTFEKGKLKTHFDDHGAEFGTSSSAEYLKMAKEFADMSEGVFQTGQVGNIFIKYEEATRKVFVGNVKTKEIRTFYVAKEGVENPFQEAMDVAKLKSK